MKDQVTIWFPKRPRSSFSKKKKKGERNSWFIALHTYLSLIKRKNYNNLEKGVSYRSRKTSTKNINDANDYSRQVCVVGLEAMDDMNQMSLNSYSPAIVMYLTHGRAWYPLFSMILRYRTCKKKKEDNWTRRLAERNCQLTMPKYFG